MWEAVAPDERCEPRRDGVGMDGFAVPGGEQPVGVLPCITQLDNLLGLVCRILFQKLDGRGAQHELPDAGFCLWGFGDVGLVCSAGRDKLKMSGLHCSILEDLRMDWKPLQKADTKTKFEALK